MVLYYNQQNLYLTMWSSSISYLPVPHPVDHYYHLPDLSLPPPPFPPLCCPLLLPNRPVSNPMVLLYQIPNLYQSCSLLQSPNRPVTYPVVLCYHPPDLGSILWSSTIPHKNCHLPCGPLLPITYLYTTLWSSAVTYQTCNSL